MFVYIHTHQLTLFNSCTSREQDEFHDDGGDYDGDGDVVDV